MVAPPISAFSSFNSLRMLSYTATTGSVPSSPNASSSAFMRARSAASISCALMLISMSASRSSLAAIVSATFFTTRK